MSLGSSRNHLSSFIGYTFNTRYSTYHTFRNKDTTILHKPSDLHYKLGVRVLGYSSNHWAERTDH